GHVVVRVRVRPDDGPPAGHRRGLRNGLVASARESADPASAGAGESRTPLRDRLLRRGLSGPPDGRPGDHPDLGQRNTSEYVLSCGNGSGSTMSVTPLDKQPAFFGDRIEIGRALV